MVAACASTAVSPSQQAEEEQRLLQPYLTERAIMADELSIDLSPNFYAEVARPALTRELHRMQQTVEAGDQVYRWTSTGGLQTPLRFRIGATDFAVLAGATLRVRGSGQAFALSTTASGRVTESATGTPLVQCREIRIEEGAYARR
ncbi:MAG: hypothetical protein AAF628_21115 [Planctomycetota bacterium]